MGRVINLRETFREIKILKEYFERGIGLMFRIKIPTDIAYIFYLDNKERYFHTFFCFRFINFIFLNENREVIMVKNRVRPFSLIKIPEKTKYVIEYVGKPKDIKVRDRLIW